MIRASRLIRELKRQLKRENVTYRMLAKRLDLSESTVKQMFASDNMSLQRLDAICEVLGIDIAELTSLCRDEDRLEALTLEQERELVADPKLLVVAYCVLNYWSVEEILDCYQLTEPECVRYLARLDRMKMIELLPFNRVRPTVTSQFNWHPDGPIEKYFHTEVQSQFFNAGFDGESALRVVKNGDISEKALHQIADRLRGIGQFFDDTTHEERRLPIDRRQGTTMVLAIRQWEFSAFRDFMRDAVSSDSELS